MFYGFVVKPGEKVQLPDDEGEVFHLSTACLNDAKNGGRSTLYITSGEEKFSICTLLKDKLEHATFDIFLAKSSNASFSVEGSAEVHLAGYFEPDDSLEGLNFDSDGEAEEVADAAEDSKAKNVAKKIIASRALPMKLPADAQASAAALSKKGQAQKKKGAVFIPAEGSDEGDSEEDMSEDDGGVAGISPEALPAVSDEDDDDDDDSESDEEAAPRAAPTPPPAKKTSLIGSAKKNETAGGEKRKIENAPPATKKAKGDLKAEPKKAAGQKGSGTPEEGYQKAILDYLTANGRCPISTVGSKVKKPEGVKGKLNQFVRERPALFKLEGQMVSLSKK